MLLNCLKGCLLEIAAGSFEVEIGHVREGFTEKVRPGGNDPQIVELVFDVSVGVLDRVIETGARWADSGVVSAEAFPHHASEEAISPGQDGADELSAVVGLNGDLREIKTVSTKVIEPKVDESGGVQGGELVGVADQSGGKDIFNGVFELGQDLPGH